MKPIQVEAGQNAPDVDEMIEKAGSMIEKLHMDNSQIRNITGVEEAPMNHYHTNQYIEESSEDVTNKGATGPESVSFMENANPHQTGSTLDAHENPSGGDAHPPSSYTHSSVGKPPSDVKKQIEIILKKRCPKCGGTHSLDKNVSCMDKGDDADLDNDGDISSYERKRSKARAKGIAAESKKAGVMKAPPPGMPPMGMPPGGPPGGGPPGGPPGMPPGGGGEDDALAALLGGAGGGEDDIPDDPAEMASKIKDIATKLSDTLGGGEGDMPPGMEGGEEGLGMDSGGPPVGGPPAGL